jgi:hypothetical protein
LFATIDNLVVLPPQQGQTKGLYFKQILNGLQQEEQQCFDLLLLQMLPQRIADEASYSARQVNEQNKPVGQVPINRSSPALKQPSMMCLACTL